MGNKSVSLKYAVGDVVRYEDMHGRVQVGMIRQVDAHWRSLGTDAWVSYTVEHQTYRNRRTYIGEDNIFRIERRT